MQFLLLILILCATVNSVLSARILGVFPLPSLSHQICFRRLYFELAKNGHELVVITPNPAIPKNETNSKIKEIDVGFSYAYVQEKIDSLNLFKNKVVADVNTVNFVLYEGFLHMIREQIRHKEVAKIIENKEQQFDLVIIEAYFSLSLVYSHIFKAPVILISSFHGLPENYNTVGAGSGHVTFYPHFNRNKFRYQRFWDKYIEFYYEMKLRYEFWRLENEGNKIIKELFGPEAPTIDMLRENVDMLFINSHPIFADNRPVPPTVVFVGGLHMQPVKALPEDLKHYLDNSKTGVVYVSLGSHIRPSKMNKDVLYHFINAFVKLPYDVLWKYDGSCKEILPKNVKTWEWLPQRDMLMHPNIKAFVTHGGLQSTDEAIDAGVPLVGIPMLVDQFFNAHKYTELGIGIQLDALNFTYKDLAKAVREVIENKKYKKNILHLRAIMQDQPQTPLNRAVWWVEYVLRHGGARHLRAPAANISWAKYIEIDLTLVIIFIFVMIIVAICYLMKILFYFVKLLMSFLTSFIKKNGCQIFCVIRPKRLAEEDIHVPPSPPRPTDSPNGSQVGPQTKKISPLKNMEGNGEQ